MLCKKLDAEILNCLSPEGQTERVNQCLEAYLRCMCFESPHKWMQWLAMAEFGYKTTIPRWALHPLKHCKAILLHNWVQEPHHLLQLSP